MKRHKQEQQQKMHAPSSLFLCGGGLIPRGDSDSNTRTNDLYSPNLITNLVPFSSKHIGFGNLLGMAHGREKGTCLAYFQHRLQSDDRI